MVVSTVQSFQIDPFYITLYIRLPYKPIKSTFSAPTFKHETLPRKSTGAKMLSNLRVEFCKCWQKMLTNLKIQLLWALFVSFWGGPEGIPLGHNSFMTALLNFVPSRTLTFGYRYFFLGSEHEHGLFCFGQIRESGIYWYIFTLKEA